MTSLNPATYRRVLAVVVAALTLLFSALCGVPAHADGQVRLSDGHTDIFNVDADGAGLHMTVKEDITGHGVLHTPEDVVLVVKEQARTALNGTFAQFGDSGYVLPLVQQPGLLWPGWDTRGVVSGGVGAVDIHFDEVSGPGKVFLATQSSGLGGGIAPLLSDNSFEVTSGSVRHQDPPAHTHAYWVFTDPGTYTMKVRATSGGTSTAAHTYTWEVGDSVASAQEPTESPAPANTTATTTTAATTAATTASSTAKPAPKFNALDDPWLNSPVADAGSSSGLSSSGQGRHRVVVTTVTRARTVSEPTSAAASPVAVNSARSTCHSVSTTTPRLVPTLRDDRVSPAKLVDPASVTFALGQASTATTHQQIGSIPANTPVWMIGATQVRDVPWLGVNTMEPDLLAATSKPIMFRLTGFSGPGDMEVFTSGNFGTVIGERWFSAVGGQPNGQVAINPNTHVHPNWVFTKPGNYVLTITQVVTLTDGRQIEVPTTLKLHVGSDDGITSGHFDLGSTVISATDSVLVDSDGNACAEASAPVTGSNNAPSVAVAAPAPAVASDSGQQRYGAALARTGVGLLDGTLGFCGLSVALLGSMVVWFNRRRALEK